jgi:hypothetical protein
MASSDEKYIVFKRDEFNAWWEEHYGPLPTPQELEDAVVIRTHDIFAGPALHVYAHSIGLNVRYCSEKLTALRLQRIADYFETRATEADEYAADDTAKIPD